MPPTVFISHSSRDGKIAQALCDALERRGASCWISSRDVGPGENFQEAIVRALRRSSAMVLVFSNNANNSNEIKKEIAIASQRKLVVIPVRVEDVVPSDAFAYELAIRQWIDLFTDWDRSLDRLVAQIKAAETPANEDAPAPAPASTLTASAVMPPAKPRLLQSALMAVVGLLAIGAAVYGARDRLFGPSEREPSARIVKAAPSGEPAVAIAPATATQQPATAAGEPAKVVAAVEAAQKPPQAPANVPPEPRVANAPSPLVEQQAAPAPSTLPTAQPEPTKTTPMIEAAPTDVASAPSKPPEPQTSLPPFRNDVPIRPTTGVATEPPPLDQVGDGGQIFRECEQCPQMVVVPAGASLLGSPPNEPGRQPNEAQPAEVSFAAPFAVARFDVSFEQWDACAAEGGCNNWRPGDYGWGRGRRPVIFVSWNDAQAYVAWLSQKTGRSYRLLTEAEWEYAARGCRSARCVTSPFWFQSGIKPELANYDSRYSYGGSPKAQAARKTVFVDDGAANPFGLVHIVGNVRKWMADCWTATPARGGASGAKPVDACRDHSVRGGSWADEPKELRAGARSWAETSERAPQIGIRVARSLTP